MRGHLTIDKDFTVNEEEVNIRIKGIRRSNIPGSFIVELLGDDDVIAAKAVYQSDNFHLSASSEEDEYENIDISLPVNKIKNYRTFKVVVRLFDPQGEGRRLSLQETGHPTVNVRFLMKE